ncbi:hypothetical protein BZG35_06520 [Brevundimonas sp. LM2]|uniref:copper chaperone PCu(A)C n=1 Tax=Brevundimonas sp. LM2 TaxID=1938605 RepID=UPI000983F009|nr:copper chaperone PCu(A)C [Brevundimonas sp. LM2]AQR61343.1 hypothetical protein BZG35_06520 [Brevundimonas sp. LM2]
MKSQTLIALLPLVVLTACGNADTEPTPVNSGTPVAAADAVCRPTANGRKVTACYLTLTASTDDTLLSASSPASARAGLHESRMESNMMMMHPIEGGLPMRAGVPVAFVPGGNHIMLNDVASPLVDGDSVALTLTFDKAPDLTVTARVGQPVVADAGSAG